VRCVGGQGRVVKVRCGAGGAYAAVLSGRRAVEGTRVVQVCACRGRKRGGIYGRAVGSAAYAGRRRVRAITRVR